MKINLLEILRVLATLFILILAITVILATRFDVIRVNDSPDPGSMYPAIMEGDAFVVLPVNPSRIQIGDVVVFKIFVEDINFQSNDDYIIHRVQAKIRINGSYYFLIKGDNYISNTNLDNAGKSFEGIDSTLGNYIPESQIMGKVYYRFSPVFSSILYGAQQNKSIELSLWLFILSLLGAMFIGGNWIERKLNQSRLNKEIKINQKNRSVWNTLQTNYQSITRKRKLILVLLLFIVLLFSAIYPLLIFQKMDSSNTQINEISVSKQDDRFSIIKGQTIAYSAFRVFVSLDIEYDPLYRIDNLEIFLTDVATGKLLSRSIWENYDSKIQGEFNFSLFLIITHDNLPHNDTQIKLTAFLQFQSIFLTKSHGGPLVSPIEYTRNTYL